MKLELSLALTWNERTRLLLDGEVAPEGVSFVGSRLFPSEMFWRQLKFSEFDVSEMSIASLTIATSLAKTDWVAIPVFTTRVFFHTDVIVRADANITQPADLAGKRVGVPEYQQTRAVWVRGTLMHEFGVDPRSIEWFMERPVERSHGGSTSFQAPKGVHLTYVPPEKDLGSMLLAGELDAAVHHFSEPNLVDRALVDLRSRNEVRRLFSDPAAENRRYFAATGIYPINHCVVIRRSLVDRYPWLPLNVYSAFIEAKRVADEQRMRSLGPLIAVGAVPTQALAGDPMTYGVAKNAHVLSTLMQYLDEQGLIKRSMSVEDVFHHSTLDL